MNIVMFTNTFLPSVGGIENSIDIFANSMRERGHNVLVIAPEYEGASTSTNEVLRVPAIKHFAGTPFSISITLPDAIVKKIKAFSPHIIHSHQPFLLGDSALRLARINGWPIVYTNHTFMERYLHWFPVDWAIVKSIAESLPVAYSNLVDHVITPTQSVAEVLQQRGVSTAITSIATGIDADFYASGDRQDFRKRVSLTPKHKVIGHLGRLNTEKNLAYLARVVLEVIKKSPDNYRFLLVGDGDCVAEIKSIFQRAGFEEQLIITGIMQGKQCADAYAAMDVFIFTSLSDTQGLVLSEAMAAGNPVFALDAPGPRDMINHGRNGFVFPDNINEAEFARQMSQVLDDPQWLCELSNNAATDAKQVSIPACTEAMLQLYQAVADKSTRALDRLTAWNKLKNRWDIEIDLAQKTLHCLTHPLRD